MSHTTIGSIPDDVAGKLEDLPDGTVILDSDGDAWQKHRNRWYLADVPDEGQYPGNIARYQPFRVLWKGEEK